MDRDQQTFERVEFLLASDISQQDRWKLNTIDGFLHAGMPEEIDDDDHAYVDELYTKLETKGQPNEAHS